MPRRKREETQPEEEEVEVRQEVKLEYDIPIPFNDATSSSSASSSIVDPKYVYLLHLDLSEVEEDTKAILFNNKIGFKALLGIDKAELKEVGIKIGDIVCLMNFAEKCKKNGNMYPPPPANQKPADDGFVIKLVQAFDPSISQSSLQTVFKHLRFATTEFWMLSDNDLVSILRDDDAGSGQAVKISNAQQYLMKQEHWNEMRIVVDSDSVGYFLEENSFEPELLDSYRAPEFVSQLLKITPKKYETVKLHCTILGNFAFTESDEGMKLVGKQEIVDSVVASSRYATSAEAVRCWSIAISNIAYNNESNQKLFGCSSIRDSVVTVSKYATSDDAVQWWSNAIINLTDDNESNRKLFGCQAVVDSFVTLRKYATTAKAVRCWISAINNITFSNRVGINRVFSSSAEFKRVFFSLKQKLEQMEEDDDTIQANDQFGEIEIRLLFAEDDEDEEEEEEMMKMRMMKMMRRRRRKMMMIISF